MIRNFSSQSLKLCKRSRMIVNFNPGTQFISCCSISRSKYKLATFKVHALFSSFYCRNIHLSNALFSLENDNSNEERVMLKNLLKMRKFDGEKVPENISEEEFQYLLNCPTVDKRISYLNYLFSKEINRAELFMKWHRKKEIIQIEIEERIKANENQHIYYGIWRNTMFSKQLYSSILNIYNYKLLSSMLHGQQIFIDLDFETIMVRKEHMFLAEHLKLLILVNRNDNDPFNLCYCNADMESQTFQDLKKKMPNIFNEDFPLNVTSKSYVDLYPKDKLIYLTSDSRDEMVELDPDAIYIIGGIVEIYNKLPHALSKAKKEGIKTQKLPVDRYHVFKKSKSLDIYIVLAILLDFQKTGCWKTAFENIPRKYLFTANENHDVKWEKKFTFSR